MKIVSCEAELKHEIRSAQREGKTIGFVPTMGALHRGHAALLESASQENDFVVLSIYVNPKQFGPHEDFEKYPRAFTADSRIAKQAKTNLIFHPASEVIYPPGYSTFIDVEGVSAPLCGKFRPGHFRGVATVVNRLFQLVEPNTAYFGQKDIQQCLVLKRMVSDFGMDIKLRFCPTIRESDGLALSSRNQYLNPAERALAPKIYEALQEVLRAFNSGERSASLLAAIGESKLAKITEFRVQYCEVLNYPDLNSLDTLETKAVCAIAAYLGTTRLIDNILLGDIQ